VPASIATLADPMAPRPYSVQRVVKETSDTFTLELRPEGGTPEMSFAPGQFNMIYAFGVGEVPISISGDPGKPGTVVHTTREVGAVTRAMRNLEPSDCVGLRGPFGVGWPVAEARGADVVIVAGGIGLAPLRPALYQLLAARNYYGKGVLLYGTRTPADILFRRELQRWHSRFDLEVHVTVDRAMGNWKGNVGVVTTLIPHAPFDPHSAIAMVCGPEVMMRFTVQELEKRGVALENIYLSMERNMKCAIGLCGHCQFGPTFICKDGPVFRYDRIQPLLAVREI
jgi:NAD(P)H-flavin reductase